MENKVSLIELGKIGGNDQQPRKHFDETAIKELSESIKKEGLIQPIMVREVSRDTFEIIHGERRYRAAKLAGLKEIPAYVREMTDDEVFHIAFIENVQREELTAVEEAQAFQWYVEKGYTHAQIAEKVSKSRTYITQKLRILNLEESIKNMLMTGKIAEGHARQIMKLEKLMNRLCGEGVSTLAPYVVFQNKFHREFYMEENISVKQVTEWIDGWHYKLVRSVVLQWMGFGDMPIVSAGEIPRLVTDITAEMMCINYGLSFEEINECDLELAINYERKVLEGLFDDDVRPWMVEQFYDSIKFEKHPLFNGPLNWIEPKTINYILLITSEKDAEGNLVINEDKMNEFIEKSTAEDRKEIIYMMLQFVNNHSSSYIDPLSIKSLYLFVGDMKKKGLDNFDDIDKHLSELEDERLKNLRNAEDLVWTCYWLENGFSKCGNYTSNKDGAIERLKREVDDMNEDNPNVIFTKKDARELFYGFFDEDLAATKLKEYDEMFADAREESVT